MWWRCDASGARATHVTRMNRAQRRQPREFVRTVPPPIMPPPTPTVLTLPPRDYRGVGEL
jgi:hypothetical protein